MNKEHITQKYIMEVFENDRIRLKVIKGNLRRFTEALEDETLTYEERVEKLETYKFFKILTKMSIDNLTECFTLAKEDALKASEATNTEKEVYLQLCAPSLTDEASRKYNIEIARRINVIRDIEEQAEVCHVMACNKYFINGEEF